MILLKQSTAVNVTVGPFLDDTDGKTPETALTISQADCLVSKNSSTFAQKSDVSAATHIGSGHYSIPLDSTDVGTLGILKISIGMAGALPVWTDFMVMASNSYDSMFGADKLEVDIVQLLGSAVTGVNDFKADVSLLSLEATAQSIKTVSDILAAMIEDGGGYDRFVASALEQSPIASLTTLESRLTSARAGYLDKLNVTGDLANTDNADSFKADVIFWDSSNTTSLTIPNHFLYQQGKGAIDFDNDVFKLILCDSLLIPNRDTHAAYINLSAYELATANGYTNGGVTLTPTAALLEDDNLNRAFIEFDPVVISASTGNIGPFRYIVVYDDTTADDTIVGIWKLDSDTTIVDGTNFPISGLIFQSKSY